MNGEEKKILGAARKEKYLSRKLWMSLGGVTLTWLIYWHSLCYIQQLADPTQVNALVSMYTTTQWIISAIVLGYLGINGVQTWRHGSTVNTVLSAAATQLNRTNESHETIEYLARPPKEEGYTLEANEID